MNDSIYTLLIIAWVAFGIYKAINKNKSKGNRPVANRPPAPQSKDTMENIFESLFQGNPSTNPIAPQPYTQTDYEDEGADSASPDSYRDQDVLKEYKEIDYLANIPEPAVVNKIDTYSGTDNFEQSIIVEKSDEFDEIKKSSIDNNDLMGDNTDSIDFDLRKAVIAQVILDRPYK